MSHDAKWVGAGDASNHPEGIALRTPEDAKTLLLQTVMSLCPGKPPGDFHSRARLLSQAITVLTATILRSGFAAVTNGEADLESISISSTYASGMLCQAVADMLTADVEHLVSERANPEFSSN